jgi:hypothetical protein
MVIIPKWGSDGAGLIPRRTPIARQLDGVMPLDTTYLVKHGQQWLVQVIVPRHLRLILGKAKLVAPLRTDSLALASREKHRHVHEFKQMIAAAELEARRKAKQTPDPLVAEALTWRRVIEDARTRDLEDETGPSEALWDEDPDLAQHETERHKTAADLEAGALEARYEELIRSAGRQKADAFVAIATAKGTSLAALVDD